ncbi:hypothetical protein [Pseudarthrobacter sp. B4EP4b]|uniref:hypothetical protein n=1 Tax=Pseudarthrobacter sp. B4EP4b TaxID=2590664 RepID=UPI00115110DB|nr:hypothetical protein [Pseudarthrobacter sp. B4EP4b]
MTNATAQSSANNTGSVIQKLDALMDKANCGFELRDSASSPEILAELHEFSAVNRADEVYGLLVRGDSAVLAGSLSRTVLESALSSIWMGSSSGSTAALESTLASDRDSLHEFISKSDLSVPNIDRWCNPIPTDRLASAQAGPGLPNFQIDLARRVPATVEAVTELPGPVANLLGMCGHLNYAAAWTSVSRESGHLGATATAPMAALFAQVAGTALASVRGLSSDSTVIDLVAACHLDHKLDLIGLSTPTKSVEDLVARPAAANSPYSNAGRPTSLLNSLLEEATAAVQPLVDLYASAPSLAEIESGDINLTSALPFYTTLELVRVVVNSLSDGSSPYLLVSASRLLLELGARIAWQTHRLSVQEIENRYIAVMDDATYRKKSMIDQLQNRGVAPEISERLFYPLGRGNFAVDNMRTPNGTKRPSLASPAEQLRTLDIGFAEPGWVELAYKLLSNGVHATPLGMLHTISGYYDSVPASQWCSPEMMALALDTACLGAALAMHGMVPILQHQHRLADQSEWTRELIGVSKRVHNACLPIHFLG